MIKKQDIYKDIEKILMNFNGYMAPAQENEEALCMFIKKDFNFDEIAERYVYR